MENALYEEIDKLRMENKRLLEACKMALNERIKMFIDPADDLLSCTLNAAIAAAERGE